MPLDQVVALFVPNSNFLNVVLVKSLDLYKPGTINREVEVVENIVINPNIICWSEKKIQHRIIVGEYFEFVTRFGLEDRDPVYTQSLKFSDCISFNLKLHEINLELLMRQTLKVDIMDLRINLVANKPFSLHCSNCATELIQMRTYRIIDPLPMYTKRVPRDFWDSLELRNISYSEQIYYGLNQIVMSANHIQFDTKMIYCRKRRRVLCPGCPRVLGTFLPRAVCLHADALRIGTRASPAARLEFNELFGHITPTQLMLRLMQDTEMSRMFLKCVRPDGQMHYMLLVPEMKKIQFLLSKPSLFSKIDMKPLDFMDADTSSESDDSSDSSNESCSSSTDEDSPNSIDNPGSTPIPSPIKSMDHARRPNTTRKSIEHVFLTPYNGYNVKYIFASTDSELCDLKDTIHDWRDNNVRSLRISYAMMIELVSELNANEHIAAALGNLAPPCRSLEPRSSHIIFESDEEFYDTQQQLDVVQVP
ncbi:uncharacterized protein LOC111068337 [Drosophila obscura]|uniref:uncharacterized protein LOC111068337 n=1 Tax=Drosophila obscura TaxID=7282 RepID=UPI001BB0F6EC|nr:uncharacterized protein LOC111068337 [Drosophila obscura]